MNPEHAILRGRLAELRERKMRLAGAIAAKLRAARLALAGSGAMPIEEIDIEGAALHLAEAWTAKAEYTAVNRDIVALEQELE